MLYYLFEYLDKTMDLPGAGVFKYITFRAGAAFILSLTISAIWGGRVINYLRRLQIGELVRDLGLDGQKQKQGTPTMGGVILILAIIIPCLLFAKLNNTYILLMLLSTVWMGIIGFIDDYIKVFKKDKEGLKGRFKILGQVMLGLIVGCTMYFSDDITVRMDAEIAELHGYTAVQTVFSPDPADPTELREYAYVKAPITNVPFLKGNEWDYSKALWFLSDADARKWVWLIFIPIVILIVTAVSNAANLTDGIDGLAAGTSAISGGTLGILIYVSGNTIFADYLNILYLPNSGELVVFSACFIGACIGFLWYNTFPAQVFMGDTGSLMLGGIIASLAILTRKEWLIPILCGIFVVENLSVVMQVSVFKYRKRKFGLAYAQANRLLLMAPLHHHFQKKGIHESKIVMRFFIVGIILAALTIITLKVR